jgi:PRD1 phage membrane DNA delivery
MGSQTISSVVTVLTAIVGLGILAVLVSKNADTSQVLTAGGKAFSGSLLAAEAPVLGGNNLNIAGTYSGAGYMT